MTGPPAAVAAVRSAVRKALAGIEPRPGPVQPGSGTPRRALVLVACSGGPDSAALAAAVAFEAPRSECRAGLVTVDHGLQPGSADQAERVAKWAAGLGLDPVEVATVAVGSAGGPEAAARTARYAALEQAAGRHGAAAVLLAHTLDDQAETVLLALARGSGARTLSGMPERRGIFVRPLLGIRREVTRAACAAEDLPTWDDPHNTDPAYSRSRVRALLPALEEATGGGAVAGLARSARLLRADAELLDALAAELADVVTGADGSLDAAALAATAPALRTRVLHGWALSLGAPAGALGASHVDALDALVTGWKGQGPTNLPGGVTVVRTAGRLRRA